MFIKKLSPRLSSPSILESQEKFRLAIILFLAILVGALEVLSAYGISLFITLITTPSNRHTSEILSLLYQNNNPVPFTDALIIYGIMSIIMLLATAIARIYILIYQGRFYEIVRSNISVRLFSLYLHQPYAFFTSCDPDSASRNLLNEVDFLVGRALMPLTTFLVSTITALILLSYLIYIMPAITFFFAALFASSYAILFFAFRRRLKLLGDQRSIANTERFRTVAEAFSAIKFLKITGTENIFVQKFKKVSESIAQNLFVTNTISQFPKSIFEIVGFGGLVAFAALSVYQSDTASTQTSESPLPAIGTVGYLLYRLLPAMQNAYQNYSSFSFARGIFAELNNTSESLEKNQEVFPAEPARLDFAGDLEMNNLSFSYSNTAKRGVLRNISLVVPRGQTVGICGRSGSGKTSLLDLIAGINSPTEGLLKRNNHPLNVSTFAAWRSSIGYVPQDTVLINGSIIQNIIFHRQKSKENELFAQKCARIAQLDGFVLKNLPDGYNTIIGGNGIRLSGGQRQRIGIARALFQRPDILILDEATSALDDITEEDVLEGIRKEFNDISIISVTHKIRTLRKFDLILILDDGKIIEKGTYSDLASRSKIFQQLGGAIKNEK